MQNHVPNRNRLMYVHSAVHVIAGGVVHPDIDIDLDVNVQVRVIFVALTE